MSLEQSSTIVKFGDSRIAELVPSKPCLSSLSTGILPLGVSLSVAWGSPLSPMSQSPSTGANTVVYLAPPGCDIGSLLK